MKTGFAPLMSTPDIIEGEIVGSFSLLNWEFS
jgi:hypothetical protein